MIGEHVISNNALAEINKGLLEGNQWLAYNTAPYFLDNHDVYMFNTKDEAFEFADSNISEVDSYHVTHVDALNDVLRQIPYGNNLSNLLEQQIENQANSLTQNTNFMNQKNFEYLKDQVKYTGFGDALENELKEKLGQRSREFQLCHDVKIGNDIVVATLNFKKSEQSDMYFFNSYNIVLKKDNSRDLMKQTFYINKGNNITLKEAYNLMDGRSVNKDLTNKEGQVYNAWVQLDFRDTDKNGNYQVKQYHTNYGYDMTKELAKHPIKELTNEQGKTRLMESLERGNRQSVTFIEKGSENKMFIEANPQFKTLNVYDNNMQRVQSQSKKEVNTSDQSAKQDMKKEKQDQQNDDSEDVPKAKQKNTNRKKQSL